MCLEQTDFYMKLQHQKLKNLCCKFECIFLCHWGLLLVIIYVYYLGGFFYPKSVPFRPDCHFSYLVWLHGPCLHPFLDRLPRASARGFQRCCVYRSLFCGSACFRFWIRTLVDRYYCHQACSRDGMLELNLLVTSGQRLKCGPILILYLSAWKMKSPGFYFKQNSPNIFLIKNISYVLSTCLVDLYWKTKHF